MTGITQAVTATYTPQVLAGLGAFGDLFDAGALQAGEDMPGLSTLQDAAASGTLEASYTDLPDGAGLSFAADDETILAVLHA